MSYKLVFLSLLLLACKKKQDYSAIRILGHACNGIEIKNSVYHDNTMEAAELALSIDGCNGIEVDVQLSADGSIFLYHDPELSKESNSSGCVASSKDEIVKAIHYKTVHQEKIASLKEVGNLLTSGLTILIDLRHYNVCNEKTLDLDLFTEKIKNWHSKLDPSIEVYAVTNHMPWIDKLNSAGFSVVFSSESMEKTQYVKSNYSCVGFMMKNAAISKSDVEKLKADHKKVIIFEVRSPKGIRKALKKFPDYLVTDDISATLIEKYR